MSQKTHIGINGPAPCHASKRPCTYGQHYDSMEEARTAYEEQMSSESNVFQGLSKKTLVENEDSTMTIDKKGNKTWTNKDGKLHRVDGPAVERADGVKEWHQNGRLHRVDGPAVEYPDGSKTWYQNGRLHRTDGPALEKANGLKEYWVNGYKISEEDLKNKNYEDPDKYADADQKFYYKELSSRLENYSEGRYISTVPDNTLEKVHNITSDIKSGREKNYEEKLDNLVDTLYYPENKPFIISQPVIVSDDLRKELKEHESARLFETASKRAEAIQAIVDEEYSRQKEFQEKIANLSSEYAQIRENASNSSSIERKEALAEYSARLVGLLEDKKNQVSPERSVQNFYQRRVEEITERIGETRDKDIKDSFRRRVAEIKNKPFSSSNTTSSSTSKSSTPSVKTSKTQIDEQAQQLSRELPSMPLSRGFNEWNKYRKEQVVRKVKITKPASGLRGWMGQEDEEIVEKTQPSSRAKAVIEWQNNLPPETKQIFDVYLEAKTAKASPEVLKKIESKYSDSVNNSQARKQSFKEQQQAMTDDYYLRKLNATTDSSLDI